MDQALGHADHAEMAVWDKQSANPGVHSLRPPRFSLLWFWSNLANRINNSLGLEGLAGIAGFSLPKQSYFRNADIIHLHLIQNRAFFSILSLPHLTRMKPVVWTIHDSWALTGMCIYSFDCERWLSGCKELCPYPQGKSFFRHHIPSIHWQIKNKIYHRSELTLIVASNWTQERVKKSPLLQHFQCRLIPYGIDLQMFKPRSKQESRKRLGLNPENKVIAFRGAKFGSYQYIYKGIQWLKEALAIFKPQEPTNLLILQDGSDFTDLKSKYQIHDLGWLDGDHLVDALCAADLFIMPSTQEAFGLMAVEAMACGIPVIVFSGTALPEVIHPPLGGIEVPLKDSVALAEAISKLLNNDNLLRKMGQQARRIAQENYSISLNIKRHLQLYKETIEQHKSHPRA